MKLDVFREILNHLQPLFKEGYFVEFGTLLGAVREGGMLSNDDDVDIGVFVEDLKDEHINYLLGQGFTEKRFDKAGKNTIRYIGKQDQYAKLAFWYKEHKVVIHILFPGISQFEGKRYFNQTFSKTLYEFEEKWFKPLRKAKMNGISVSTPKEQETLLEYIYGKDWVTDKPKYKESAEYRRNRKRFVIKP